MTNIRFHKINSAAQSYPKPSLPAQPIFSCSALKLTTDRKNKYSTFINQGAFYVNARTALTHALILSGVNTDSSVLLPAYHCGSMIEPALWLGADVLLYPITRDLQPEKVALEALIDTSKKTIRAMVLPHYFGFIQPVQYWREFCDHNKISLIEDCAHAFFSKNPNLLPGSLGDYAIASTRKFFGCADGGILIGKKITHPDQQPCFNNQVRTAAHLLLKAAENGGLGTIGKHLRTAAQLRNATHKPNQPTEHSPPNYQWLEPNKINLAGQPSSHWLMRHSNFDLIINKRRANYQRLANGLSTVAGLQPLFAELPESIVPYMLPARLTGGDYAFNQLKQAGIPIWRWDELALSNCSISQTYRTELLHLPCHQNLASDQIDWLVERIIKALECI